MKVTFVFNQTKWVTEKEKVQAVCNFFAPIITIEPTILHTDFTNIPLVSVGAIGGITNTIATTSTIDTQWYDKNITSLSPTADIIVFYMVPADVGRTSIAIEQGKVNEVVQCAIFGIKETDDGYVNMVDLGNSYVLFACHEISHALYLLEGKTDNTHAYFYTGQPKKVLDELKTTLTNPVNLTQKPTPEVYLWDNPTNARHSVRVLCDEMGLTVYGKNIITACIQQESNFNPHVMGKPNHDGTIDYGICQFNNGHNVHGVPFWIGPGAYFSSTDEVLNNPEKCVREMITQYKLGHISWWSSYSTGAYLKYMPK